MELLPLLVFATLLATCHASQGGVSRPIHPLRQQHGSGGFEGVSCMSWRLAIETYNLRDWKTIPLQCEFYVGHYMLGHLYRKDSKAVIYEALAYAESLNLTGNGKEVWVFDIDETALSNLPYYAHHGFGAEPYNSTLFYQWVYTGKALTLPETLKLYNKILSLGMKVVFLSGRPETQRRVTVRNLKKAGYFTWEKLLLKGPSYTGKSAIVFKSAERMELEKQGYTIVGNIGDQWSDILGTPTGQRTFKLPDPMYYIG